MNSLENIFAWQDDDIITTINMSNSFNNGFVYISALMTGMNKSTRTVFLKLSQGGSLQSLEMI